MVRGEEWRRRTKNQNPTLKMWGKIGLYRRVGGADSVDGKRFHALDVLLFLKKMILKMGGECERRGRVVAPGRPSTDL